MSTDDNRTTGAPSSPSSEDIAARGVCPYSGHSTNANGSPVTTEEHSVTVGEQGPVSYTHLTLPTILRV